MKIAIAAMLRVTLESIPSLKIRVDFPCDVFLTKMNLHSIPATQIPTATLHFGGGLTGAAATDTSGWVPEETSSFLFSHNDKIR